MSRTDPDVTGASRGILSLWDAISLLVGIVIGTAIFRMPGAVFRSVDGPLPALGLWIAGGALSVAGALCYAELAAAYPRSGGDYEYLSRAYGRAAGLQFAWAQLLVVLTGSVGSMAYAFADYARAYWGLSEASGIWLAAAALSGLTGLNLLGVRFGTTTQNLLTLAKLAGLAAIVLLSVRGTHWSHVAASSPVESPNGGLALVFILYAYSGWTHAAYVAAEVDDPQRSLPRTLTLGVGGVMAVYLLVNLAYVGILGLETARDTETPAADAVGWVAGPTAARGVSLLVMLSALGAINGTILTGAFLLRELGRDYSPLDWLGRTSSAGGVPTRALLAISTVSLLLVLGVGTEAGRTLMDSVLRRCRMSPIPWREYHGGFETLVAAAAPLFWVFQLLTGTTVFVLRRRDPDRQRPFRVPGYPLTPLAFCGACAFMLWKSVEYARGLTLIAVIPIVSAAAISWRARSGGHGRVGGKQGP